MMQLDRKLSEARFAPQSNRSSLIKERQKVIEATGSNINTKKMEAALNDWLEQVEEQVNLIQDKLSEKASIFDLQQIDYKVDNEVKDRQYATD